MSWSLVTAPDERARCMVAIDGSRCDQPVAWIVRSADGSLDDYARVCADHVVLVAGAGYVIERATEA